MRYDRQLAESKTRFLSLYREACINIRETLTATIGEHFRTIQELEGSGGMGWLMADFTEFLAARER